MATQTQNPMGSTPAFNIFRRGLVTQTIQKFRGINAYSTIVQLTPDWAQDLLNVIVSGSGGLSKLRLPVKLSVAIPAQNAGPSSFWDFQQGNGTRQVLAFFGQLLYYFTNDLALATFVENNVLNVGQWSLSVANNILFGVNGQRAQKWTGANWQIWGLPAPQIAPIVSFAAAGTLNPTTGLFYGFAWKNSVTGHCGNISLSSPNTGPFGPNTANATSVAAPPDPQVDTLVWFRSLDAGGDLFRLAEVNINNGVVSFNGATVQAPGVAPFLSINDQTPDGSLDQTVRGPLINNPPIIGKYTAVGQGRVLIFNLLGAPQDIIYSGYEQIYFGRPEESFPPNNRLRLSIGAEEIAGGAILQAGVVAFSRTHRMYMLRGQLEDISLTVPINYSAYLEELPWQVGCFSHATIKVTPYGLIWHAQDKTVQLFNGTSEPIDISPGVYPLLRQITPGTENAEVAGYFNWLERDWYALLCAVNGSTSINRLFLFAFNKAVGSDQIESVETFISDLPVTLGGATWIDVITTSKLQRMLCIGAQGFIQQLPVSSTTINGLTQDLTITPATAGSLNAYWRGGYFGNDAPQASKMFRWLRLITDQAAQAFAATLRYVDDELRTFMQPEIIGPLPLGTSRLGMNHRAKRASVEINFPQRDVDSNVVELQVASIHTSDR